MSERSLTIETAPAEQWPNALALVFQSLPEGPRRRQLEAMTAQFASEPGAANGLIAARRGDQLVGAVLIQIQPGRVASLWPPQIAPSQQSNAADAHRLLSAGLELAHRAGSRIVQALLPTDAGIEAERLQAGGLEHIADLLYLVSPASSFPANSPTDELDFAAFSSTIADSFAQLVQRTYEGTCDCPRLNGVRPIDEVLEGYRAVGRWTPSHWLVARSEGREVGCLLLAAHDEHKLWELVYMGVVPEARGRGLGLAMTRHGQWLAGRAGAERLVLAVDAANEPAIRGYAAAGFVGWDRRSVFFKQIS